MFRFAGNFWDARIVENLHGGCGTKSLPILQYPDDLFVRGDFDKLRAFAAGDVATGAEDRVAVGQTGAALRRGGETILFRQVGVLEFPNRLALRIHFAREAVMFVGDQSVSVL